MLLFAFLEFLRDSVFGELTRKGPLTLSCTSQVTDTFLEEGNFITGLLVGACRGQQLSRCANNSWTNAFMFVP